MEHNEVKIKSYQYLLQNILILFAIVSTIFFVAGLLLDKNDYRRIIFVSIMVPIISFWLICAIITRLGCRTYDIYSESGIKRIRGNKIIFEIKWDNVESLIYFNIGEIIILSPFVLNIDLYEALNSNENRSYDNNKSITTPMRPKLVKQIAKLVPIVIKKLPK